MSRVIPDWVKVGQKVIMRSGGFNARYGATAEIAKVYKNGNFILSGSDKQWRPFSDRAHEAGYVYDSSSCYPLTPELVVEVAAERALQAAKLAVQKESDRLETLWRRGDASEILDCAKMLAERDRLS